MEKGPVLRDATTALDDKGSFVAHVHRLKVSALEATELISSFSTLTDPWRPGMERSRYLGQSLGSSQHPQPLPYTPHNC